MHARKQENTVHIKEKCQPIKTEPEMTQSTELINKKIDKCYLYIFHIFKKLQGRLTILSRDMEEIF